MINETICTADNFILLDNDKKSTNINFIYFCNSFHDSNCTNFNIISSFYYFSFFSKLYYFYYYEPYHILREYICILLKQLHKHYKHTYFLKFLSEDNRNILDNADPDR